VWRCNWKLQTQKKLRKKNLWNKITTKEHLHTWNRSMEMELKKITKAQKELEKPIVEEISTKREPMEKCACNRKEIQQQATT